VYDDSDAAEDLKKAVGGKGITPTRTTTVVTVNDDLSVEVAPRGDGVFNLNLSGNSSQYKEFELPEQLRAAAKFVSKWKNRADPHLRRLNDLQQG
jgi:hypothetical protein